MVREIRWASLYGPGTVGGAAVEVVIGATCVMAWAITGSVSMLAAGVLTLVVGVNESVTLVLGRRPDRVVIALFMVGSLVALAGGIDALRGTHVVMANPLGYGALVVAFWLEGTSVLADDRGTFAGLVVALAGSTSAALTGNTRYDAMGSVVIGVLLAATTVALVMEATGGVQVDRDDPSMARIGRSR